MAVALGQLYNSCKSEYGLKVVAGSKGLGNLTEWIHITEESGISRFLRGRELVFTTGIMNNTAGWLLGFVVQLYKAGAAGLVVNLGPYIPEIDAGVLDYCNENSFPLFTLPWKTRIVDVTRDFCTILNRNVTAEAELAFAFRGLVLHLGDEANNRLCLASGGFKEPCPYYVAVLGLREGGELPADFKSLVERAAKEQADFYCSFDYDNGQNTVLLMCCPGEETPEAFIYSLKSLLRGTPWEGRLVFAAGSRETALGSINKSFKRAVTTYNVCKKRSRDYMLYESLDIYKLLFSIEDRDTLEAYYRAVLGPLEAYDLAHQSNYLGFLKTYLDNNASPQLVSEKEFMHRNTVINHLKKIDAITGLDLFQLDDKLKCRLAFAIKEML